MSNLEEMQTKQLKQGKLFLWLIAGSEILCALFALLFNFNFQQLVFSVGSIIFAALLLGGYTWVRHLYALIAVANVILGMAATMVFFDVSEAALRHQVLFYGGWILFILINLAVAGLLYFNKAVKEYMYWKRNG